MLSRRAAFPTRETIDAMLQKLPYLIGDQQWLKDAFFRSFRRRCMCRMDVQPSTRQRSLRVPVLAVVAVVAVVVSMAMEEEGGKGGAEGDRQSCAQCRNL
jgi:hypothetical protein